jgi:hypothetical protein
MQSPAPPHFAASCGPWGKRKQRWSDPWSRRERWPLVRNTARNRYGRARYWDDRVCVRRRSALFSDQSACIRTDASPRPRAVRWRFREECVRLWSRYARVVRTTASNSWRFLSSMTRRTGRRGRRKVSMTLHWAPSATGSFTRTIKRHSRAREVKSTSLSSRRYPTRKSNDSPPATRQFRAPLVLDVAGHDREAMLAANASTCARARGRPVWMSMLSNVPLLMPRLIHPSGSIQMVPGEVAPFCSLKPALMILRSPV